MVYIESGYIEITEIEIVLPKNVSEVKDNVFSTLVLLEGMPLLLTKLWIGPQWSPRDTFRF